MTEPARPPLNWSLLETHRAKLRRPSTASTTSSLQMPRTGSAQARWTQRGQAHLLRRSHHYPVPCDQAGNVPPSARSLKSGKHRARAPPTPRRGGTGTIELSDGRSAIKRRDRPVRREGGHDHVARLVSGSLWFWSAVRPPSSRCSNSSPRCAFDATVLLQGRIRHRQGTRRPGFHEASRRSARAFIDCSVSPPRSLFESECSVTSAAPSPAPARARSAGRGGQRRHAVPRRAPRTSRCRCRSSCCASFSKLAPTGGSAALS